MGERTFRRWCRRYEEDGEAGLLDRRIGKASGKRVPVDRCEEVEALYRTRYQRLHGAAFPRALWCAITGLPGATAGPRHFCKAESAGEGAAARRAPAQAAASSVAGDDAASGRIAAWVDGGSTAARPGRDDGRCDERDLFGVAGGGRGHGLDVPCAAGGVRPSWPAAEPVYRPRQPLLSHGGGRRQGGSHQPTQVGRALAHLGVEHIAAYSPQARGRSERLFRTLQDRLAKELALADITTVAAANACLRDTYIPAHNARFAVKAEQEGSAFVAVPGLDLAEMLCVQEERLVGNDNCVAFLNRRLQIPASPLRAHFVQGDSEGAPVSRRWSGDLPRPALPGPLRQQRGSTWHALGGPAREHDRYHLPPPAWSRARGRQGRCAPLRGRLTCGEAILDRPCARHHCAWQVGSGKWSCQSHQEMPVGDTAPPSDKTATSGHMMCYLNRPT